MSSFSLTLHTLHGCSLQFMAHLLLACVTLFGNPFTRPTNPFVDLGFVLAISMLYSLNLIREKLDHLHFPPLIVFVTSFLTMSTLGHAAGTCLMPRVALSCLHVSPTVQQLPLHLATWHATSALVANNSKLNRFGSV